MPPVQCPQPHGWGHCCVTVPHMSDCLHMYQGRADRFVGFDDTGAMVYEQPEIRCVVCDKLLSAMSRASAENGAFPEDGVLHETAPVCRHYSQMIGFDPTVETNNATCVCTDCGAILGTRTRESWDLPWSESWPMAK